MVNTTEIAAPDLTVIKGRQQATWAAGDFGVIGTTLQIVGESLCEAVDLRSGSKVLDVAAGNGNCSLAAARRWCDVTSTDYVPALLEDGRRRAEGERLPITFQVADAEALPFDDGSFDVVLSSFGVMFAPNHEQTARELLRVCRSGGRIGLANWTPRGFIGQLFAVVGRHVPPPAGVTPPSKWGTEAHLDHLFRDRRCGHPHDSARLRVPLQVPGALDRGVPHLVRPGAQGLWRAGAGDAGGAAPRPAGSDRAVQRQRRRDDGRARRIR